MMDQATICQLSDSDLLKAQERTIYDIDYGCWPLHEYMATACRLTLEWTRRQRESDPKNADWEAWNQREKAAGLVVEMVDDCLQLIATGQSQKAAHTAALAANLFFSFGPTTALYDMQKAERIKAEQISNRNSKNAQNPRPGARDPMKQLIIDAMRPHKRQKGTLNDFMSAWKREPQNWLILTAENPEARHDQQSYVVTYDGPAESMKDVPPNKECQYSTLKDYWKEA